MNHTTVILKLALFSDSLSYIKVNRNHTGSKVTLNFISCVDGIAK